MSFYCGHVAKLIQSRDNRSIWEIVDIIYLDTNCDENMNINFSHSINPRASFVPVDVIKDFNLTTKKVKRIFVKDTGTECWEAQNDC